MKRSALACEWTAGSFTRQGCRVYFWTLTTVEETSPGELLGMWDVLLKRLRRLVPGIQFVRVLEPHASGRRFHLHLLLNERLHVGTVRGMASPLGFGRVHVARVRDGKAAEYVAKYVSKGKRIKALKGVRLWSASLRPDGWVRHCIRDVETLIDGKPLRDVFALRAMGLGVAPGDVEKAKRDAFTRELVLGMGQARKMAADYQRRMAAECRERGDGLEAAAWDAACASDAGRVEWKRRVEDEKPVDGEPWK